MTYSVLLIEDNPEECARVSDALRRSLSEPLDIVCCRSYEEAFAPLFTREWNLILINYHLSPRNGLETLRRARWLLDDRKTPAVIYHACCPEETADREAFNEGAADFLTHAEMSRPEGMARIVAHLKSAPTNHWSSSPA